MKKRALRLLALLLTACVAMGCLALAEDAPEAAEVVDVVETPVEPEPDPAEAPEPEPADEPAESEEIPAESEPEVAPEETPSEDGAEEPVPEEEAPEAEKAPVESLPEEDSEEAPAEPEAPEEEAPGAEDPECEPETDPEAIPGEDEEAPVEPEEEIPEEVALEEGEGEEIFEVPQEGTYTYNGLTIVDGVVTACNDESISHTIPSGVTAIGDDAFNGNVHLAYLTIADTVTRIGESAFSGCISLEYVTMPDSVTYIDSQAFWGCKRLPADAIPRKLEHLGSSAFAYAFEYSNVTSVTLPSTLREIGDDNPFRGCKPLEAINVASGNAYFKSVNGVLYSKNGKRLIGYPRGKKGDRYTIPQVVEVVGGYAFEMAGNLVFSITLPEGVKRIESNAFNQCVRVPSFSLPSTLQYIGDSAFCHCYELNEITIPASVTTMGDKPLNDCTSLKNINVASGNPSYRSVNGVLYTGDGTKLIQFPAGKLPVEATGSVTLPAGVKTIGQWSFVGAEGLNYLTLPDGMERIEHYAFYQCTYLASVTIPASVTYIDSEAFTGNYVNNITIYGYTGSRAETYAAEKGFAFVSLGEAPANVIAASADVERIPAKEDITFTVTTPAAAKFLAMFAESGAKVKTWGMTGNSTVSGDTRTWTVKYAVSNPGSRKLTFKCARSTTYGNGQTVSVRVLTARPAVTSVSASPNPVEKGKTVTFTVVTPTSAKFVAMYSESGDKVKSWNYSGNSTVSGSTRTWTIPYAISGVGNRTLTFKCCADGYAYYGAGKSVSFKVTNPLIAVTSASASPTTAKAKDPVTFTVKTPSTAKYLAMYAENGSKVKVWGMTNYSTVSGSTRTWTVTYAIAGRGSRVLTFKCSANGTYGAGKAVNVTVK